MVGEGSFCKINEESWIKNFFIFFVLKKLGHILAKKNMKETLFNVNTKICYKKCLIPNQNMRFFSKISLESLVF